MPLAKIEELKNYFDRKSDPKNAAPRKLLGLDVGTKTIGLAISDSAWRLATPLDTIKRTKFTADMAALAAIIDDRGVGGLVMGLPLNMDGSAGKSAQSIRTFAHTILKTRDIPIVLWDERLSTAVAERHLIAQDVSRKRRAESIDKIAAHHILQGALERLATIDGL